MEDLFFLESKNISLWEDISYFTSHMSHCSLLKICFPIKKVFLTMLFSKIVFLKLDLMCFFHNHLLQFESCVWLSSFLCSWVKHLLSAMFSLLMYTWCEHHHGDSPHKKVWASIFNARSRIPFFFSTDIFSKLCYQLKKTKSCIMTNI